MKKINNNNNNNNNNNKAHVWCRLVRGKIENVLCEACILQGFQENIRKRGERVGITRKMSEWGPTESEPHPTPPRPRPPPEERDVKKRHLSL